ncbi:hypothetical protein CO172_00375 [Candidatus Uhrbacteria bacterium CG_4_9_14_3_um_filter_36_7]|uniref:Glycerophosphoryl diester phosphodiesterase membrane domain-containing protein n=1 Tax=Candidatus Uhrbacteria bacterium CG_4_9_14_3_um_filter_36_7 TaxID=1975033 RepID=A0A2M7XIA4_9BACT|nr:MAG: hypothetical protein CO172_00375 [Candidatus Uhrbacteria bacterium CG_4_9_14_3_um_filter_36_7]
MSNLISVGQIIDRSWEIYRRFFLIFINIAGWLLIPTFIGLIALALIPSGSAVITGQTLSTSQTIGAILLSINNFFLAPIIGIWVFITLIRTTSHLLEKQPINISKQMKESWNYFLPIIWVGILVTLLIVAALLFIAPGLILNIIGGIFFIDFLSIIGAILILIGAILAVIFGFRWLIHYAFAQYILLIENVRGKKSLTRSRELVAQKFWPFFIRLVIPKMIFFLIAIIAESAILYFADAGIKLLVGLNADLELRLTSMAAAFALSLITILINPLIITADLLLYQSLKEQNLKKDV